MSATISSVAPAKFTSAAKMQPGQVGTFFYGGEKILALRTYSELVDLNRPIRTWNVNASFDIELLPEGSIIELKVETFKEE